MSGKTNLNIWLVTVFIFGIAGTASGRIIYVDADGALNGDGSTWEDAYRCLQNALVAARYGDEIRVATGVYKPDQNVVMTRSGFELTSSGDRTATFQLKNGIKIEGGYAGSNEPNPDMRDINKYETILSGDLNADDVEIVDPNVSVDEPSRLDNSHHVVTGSDTDVTAILDGFTITGGSIIEGHGAGMFNISGSPTVSNCIFRSNSVYSVTSGRMAFGAGMYNNYSSDPTVVGCTFSGNLGDWGGGMWNGIGSSPIITNCIFNANMARKLGGGMFNTSDGNPIVNNCIFKDNSASAGGGMWNAESSPKLTNCKFIGNSAGNGGGIYNLICRLTLANCIFNGNSSYSGGGMCNEDSSTILTNCIFSRNWTLRNPTTNRQISGGGILNYHSINFLNSNLTLINCTFAGNSGGKGNAISCGPAEFPSNLQLSNCILWDGGDEISNEDGSTITINYCNMWGGETGIYDPHKVVFWGVGNIDADPCFIEPGGLAANGELAEGDYHLLPDSPCINMGNPHHSGDAIDIDSESRVMLGRVDIGADELNPFIITFIVVNKRRINRAVFEYECEVLLENLSRFEVTNVQLEMVKASKNMTIIEPNITFGNIKINSGESATSVDTCIFNVDRSEVIDPAEVVFWELACETLDAGAITQHKDLSVIFLGEELKE